MTFIKNRSELLSTGSTEGRRIALEIIEHTLMSIDSYTKVKEAIRWENDTTLRVVDMSYDLSAIDNVYVLGAGKATFPIARALEEIMGSRLRQGLVIVKKGYGKKLKRIEVLEAGHPIPDEVAVQGSKRIVEIARQADEQDLVFCAITGGASSLMSLPVQGISLRDKQRVTKLLLQSGVTLYETNTVRKHISAVKGGKLAQCIHPARIVNLIVIDEVEGVPWGPTVPDETTFQDAIGVLKRHDIWNRTPQSIKRYLMRGIANPALETPKQRDFGNIRVQNVVLADNQTACEAARQGAAILGLDSMILSSQVEGESREAGIILACIAKNVEKIGEPMRPPCVLIMGGETTVRLSKHWGLGGPSQELALGASLKIAGSRRITIASLDTDGTDGPTSVAGGIVDGCTLKRAAKRNVDVFKNLMDHNSLKVLTQLNDAIVTGPTGTNVADLTVAVITQ